MHGCLNAQVYRRRRSYAAVLQNDSKRFQRGLVRTRHRLVPSTSAQYSVESEALLVRSLRRVPRAPCPRRRASEPTVALKTIRTNLYLVAEHSVTHTTQERKRPPRSFQNAIQKYTLKLIMDSMGMDVPETFHMDSVRCRSSSVISVSC